MFLRYFGPRKSLLAGLKQRPLAALFFVAALAVPACYADAQSGSQSPDDLRQTLLNAERAIMEGLSAQAVGASPAVVPVLASVPVSQPKPLQEPVKVEKKAQKPAPVAKKAPPPPAPVPAKPQHQAKQPQSVALPSDAEVKLSAVSKENESLRAQLSSLQGRIAKLEEELVESRSQLTVAETEASRLATMVDAKTRASLGRYNVPMPQPAQPKAAEPKPAPVAVKPVEEVKPPSRSAEMQIATVTVDKADLRVGPGKNNSALMSLRRGSRLAVEERQGEWYRVFAPNGQRAWIQSSLVSFGDGASSMNDGSAVKVKGYSSNAEEEAFRRLQKISSGK